MQPSNANRIRGAVEEVGFYLEEDVPGDELQPMLATLGQVIHTTDVIANPTSRKLVTSTAELNLHTDHRRADFVAWQCLEQCELGGESLLIDAESIFCQLSLEDQAALLGIELTEHAVFPDDARTHPMITAKDGKRRFYYSFWLAGEVRDPAARKAIAAFDAALSAARARKLRLRPGDILICDNGRMLHGRTAIEGRGRRHLKRFWIEATNKESTKMTTFTFPQPITRDRVEFLKGRGVDQRVAEIDLSMVKMKLQDGREGKGWTEQHCEDVELEYKRFLTLNLLFPRSIVPTSIIDDMWHYHILDTRAYHSDSTRWLFSPLPVLRDARRG